MVKPRRKYVLYRRNRLTKEQNIKNFERGFSLLFNRKPAKRKNKINKILQEQQAVLTKERIFINPQGSNLLKQSNSKIISSIGQ